jgi:hypothetical protein
VSKVFSPLRKIVSTILLIILLIPLLCCLGLIVLSFTPYGLCLDFVSGKAPKVARERFIDLVAQAVKEEDYEWLATVSQRDAVEELKLLRSKMTSNYTVEFTDDLAGLYEGNVHFDNGTVIHFNLNSIWPECPDYDVTEEEIIKHIRLGYIIDVTNHH